jgi:hypothetical protein
MVTHLPNAVDGLRVEEVGLAVEAEADGPMTGQRR